MPHLRMMKNAPTFVRALLKEITNFVVDYIIAHTAIAQKAKEKLYTPNQDNVVVFMFIIHSLPDSGHKNSTVFSVVLMTPFF